MRSRRIYRVSNMRSSYYLFSVSERLKNFVYEIREYIFEIYNIDHEKDIEEKKGRVLEQDIDNTQNTNEGQTDRRYENTILRTMLCKRTSISRTLIYENQDALDDWHNDKT